MSLFRNCRAVTVQFRGFASSSSLRVGPESPNYIEVPQSVQPDIPSKPRVKGTLPVPRELFPVRRKDKPTQAYLDAVAPLPSKEIQIDPKDPHAEYIQRKRELATMRRENLHQGLKELHTRKQRTDDIMMKRSLEKQQRRERVLQQPEREDERLTRPSVTQDMLPKHTPVLPNPGQEARFAQSQLNYKNQQALKEQQRQDMLHELYMNARNFITTEEQLAAEITRVFPDGDNNAWLNDTQPGDNVWNLGQPPTVQAIVNQGKRSDAGRWEVIQDRVKKLGEQLTGGKM
ncbi:hypothetical protein BO71DRAFT_400207 [Aspergillus ellipticus CBS 707.79]|uniref:Uncharacterized protein n=1 Tax=Aspergillus ellipticus CBS 707.79 TaxID=1448320 RepID=A0A319D6T7_9EURO|nr:hypothetical protein BO71DRAFT_400207 [Aspergillus ellipticus CBS 707.79]